MRQNVGERPPAHASRRCFRPRVLRLVFLSLLLLAPAASPPAASSLVEHAQDTPPQGQPSAQYQFYDSFDARGVDTAKWRSRDSGTAVFHGLGALVLATSHEAPSWGDPALSTTATFARVPGRSFVNVVRSTVAFGSGPLMHLSPVAFPANASEVGHGILLDKTGAPQLSSRFNAVVPGAVIPYAFPADGYDPATVRSIDYVTATVLRGAGSFHVVSGGAFGAYPQATLLWVDDQGSASELRGGIAHKDGVAGVTASGIVDLPEPFASEYGLARAVATFDRANGTTVGTTEHGGRAWTEPIGDVEIIDRSVSRVGSAEARAVFDSGVSEGIFEMHFSTPRAPFAEALFYVRYQDEGNWWRISCNTNSFWLEKSISGVVSTVNSTNQAGCAANTTVRMVVRAHGPYLNVWLNNASPMFSLGIHDPSLSAATGVGVGFSGGDASPRVHRVVVWPKTVTLPDAVGTFPAVPDADSTVIVRDTFSAADGTRLRDHRPEQGGAWTEVSGTWTIRSGTALPSQEGSLATIETGSTDIAVTTTINLPGGEGFGDDPSGGWMIGPVARYVDPQNFLWARFLWQGGSPEIEMWEVVDGVANPGVFDPPGFLNATNLTDLLAPGTHTLKLVVSGQEVAAYLDGRLAVQGTTSLPPGTRAGVIVNDVPIRLGSFADFVVTAALPAGR